MSLMSDLLSVGGSIYGSKTIADAQRDAANTTAQAQRDINKNTLDFIAGGAVDAYGNVINKRDPTTGALTTTLTGKFKDLANQNLSAATKAADTKVGLGNVAKRGVADFAGWTGTGGRPDFSRADATAITTADDQRKIDSVLKPALINAAIMDNRRLGGTSNAGNIVGKTMKEILPQTQFGGETRALELKNKMDEQFKADTIGLSNAELQAIAQPGLVPIPGVANAGEVGNLANAMRVPAPTPGVDLGSASAFLGLNQLGNVINKNESQQLANEQFNAILGKMGTTNDSALQAALLAQRLKANNPDANASP